MFYGRIQLQNIGKVAQPQPEYMEEDFLYANDDDNELEFDLNTKMSDCKLFIPNYDMHDTESATSLVHIMMQQEKQKLDVFEATEANICRNRRYHIKKIRCRHFNIGDTVLFRNPEHTGLASTLNVVGHVQEKVGRDLYRVEYVKGSVILFSSQMVLHVTSIDPPSEDTHTTTNVLQPHMILDKIGMYADLQQQYFAARRQYKQQMDWDGMEAIIRDIGYDFRLTASPDLQLLLYLALDCGFFATLTDDKCWMQNLTNTTAHYCTFYRIRISDTFLAVFTGGTASAPKLFL